MALPVKVRVHCPVPDCNRAYDVDPAHLGRRATCKACGHSFIIATTNVDAPDRPSAPHKTGSDSPQKVFASIGIRNIAIGEGIRKLQYLRGRLTIEGETFTIAPKTLFFSRRKRISFPLNSVHNLALIAARISFEVIEHDSKPKAYSFEALNEPEAAKLASLLPTRKTREQLENESRHKVFLRDLNEATPVACATLLLVACNILLYVIMGVSGAGWFTVPANTLLAWGGQHSMVTTSGQWWRLLTGAFLHIGFIHLFFNMQALLAVGIVAEKLFGVGFYLLLYLFCAVASSLVAAYWSPNVVVAGASGAVFAIYASLLAYVLFQRSSVPIRTSRALRASALAFLAYNLIVGVRMPGISNAAHVGGLAAGFVLGSILCRPLERQCRLRQARPRAIVAAVIGTFGIVLGAWHIPKPDHTSVEARALASSLLTLETQENILVDKYNSMVASAKNGALRDADLAAALESEIIPGYASLAKTVSSVAPRYVPFAPEKQGILARLWELQRDAYMVLASCARTNDERLAKRYQEMTKEIEQLHALAAQSK